MTVTPVNDAPVAVNDAATVVEDISKVIDVLTNDTDVDIGDTLSIVSVTAPAHGTVDDNGTHITYTPTANYNGPDSFSYTISDGNGGTATATVSITVTAVNDAPVAVNDAATVDEDSIVDISVLLNDIDVDIVYGDTLSITFVTVPANGTAVINGDQITYTPDADYNGADSFIYTVSDGQLTDTATVSITVTPVADGGNGGGCTYNPDSKSFDLMFIVMMMMSFFYPLRRKYLS